MASKRCQGREFQHTEIKAHRSSVAGMELQVLEKSKRVVASLDGAVSTGGAGGSTATRIAGVAIVAGVGEAVGLGLGTVSVLDGNIVLSPEARNMPPPTRLGFALSRACLTSLKVRGSSCFVEGGGDDDARDSGDEILEVDEEDEDTGGGWDFKDREDTGSSVSVAGFVGGGTLGSVFGDGFGTGGELDGPAVVESMMVMGTLRRFGAASWIEVWVRGCNCWSKCQFGTKGGFLECSPCPSSFPVGYRLFSTLLGRRYWLARILKLSRGLGLRWVV